MISNVVSYIPTFLGLAWSVTTAVPVIECAVRAIWHFGELSANRAQYHTSSVEKIYAEEKNQFIETMKADFNSKLPSSCLPDANQPDAPKLKLKFVNSNELVVDLESFKLYCGTFKKLAVDYLDAPDAKEFLMPFLVKNDGVCQEVLRSYLIYRSNLNFSALDDKNLLEMYDLAMYLDMPDLEAQCMLTIVERFIKTESPILKDGLEKLDHHYKKGFNRLFGNVEELKTGHLSEALVNRLNNYNEERLEVIKNIGKTLICGLLFIPLPLFPLAIKYIAIPSHHAHLVGIARLNIRCCQLYYPMLAYIAFCSINIRQGNTANFLRTYPAVNRIANIYRNVVHRFFTGTVVGRVMFVTSLAIFNVIEFTATKIYNGTIFIAQSIIQASGFIYNKIGQGVNKISQELMQIPTTVTAGLIAGTVLLVAAKQFG